MRYFSTGLHSTGNQVISDTYLTGSAPTNWWDDGNLVSRLQDQKLISKMHVLLPNSEYHLIPDDSKPGAGGGLDRAQIGFQTMFAFNHEISLNNKLVHSLGQLR